MNTTQTPFDLGCIRFVRRRIYATPTEAWIHARRKRQWIAAVDADARLLPNQGAFVMRRGKLYGVPVVLSVRYRQLNGMDSRHPSNAAGWVTCPPNSDSTTSVAD